MKRFVLAALCGTALVSAADAADLAARAPMYTKAPVAQVYDWTGFYIGGNVGYAHSHMSASDQSFSAISGAGTLALPDSSSNSNGFTGGGQIGYNYQIGQTVLGVEGDFNYIGAKANNIYAINLTPVSSVNASDSLKSDWFATVRGRVGYSFGAFMPYITGGVAFMHTKAEVSINDVLVGVGPATYDASQSKTLVGYAVGVGGEYALDKNWSIRGEYLHMGFGGQDYDLNSNLNIGTLGSFAVTGHERVKSDYDIARVGVNYRFH